MGETQNEKGKAERAKRIAIMISSAVCGAILWIMLSTVTGDKEAWDSMNYCSVGIPALFLMAFTFGWLCRDRPLIPGAWLGLGHGAGSFLSGLYYSSGFGLWPLSLGLIGASSLILALISLIGGLLARLWYLSKTR